MLNRTRSVSCLVMFALLATFSLGDWQWLAAQERPRGGTPPVIDRDSPVTSRAQIGTLRNGLVILCPEQSKTIDLSARFPGRFTAEARSADTRIASASVATDRQNHIILTIRAGKNDTERDQITTITVTTRHEVLQTGIPPAPPAGTRDEGYGIHGSGPNSRPHSVPGRRDDVRTGTITVRVLSARTCNALPEENNTRGAIRTPGGQPQNNANTRRVRMCVRTSRNLNMQTEINTQANRLHRTDRRRTPLVRGLRILSNTNPAVASAEVMGNYGRDGNLTNDPIYLLFRGLSAGETTISVSEYPLPVNVIPFSRTYQITVEDCSDEDRRAFIRQWSAVPHGYRVMPEQVLPPREEDPLGDDWDDPVPDRRQSSTGLKLVEEGDLAKLVGTVNGSELAIQCPPDAQQGDMISCSVLSDGIEQEDYVIEVTSTAEFQDNEEDPPQTHAAIRDGLFSTVVPVASALKQTKMGLALKDKTGNTLCTGELPVKPQGTYTQPSQFAFPQEVAQGTEAVRISGPFTEPVDQTQVMVAQKPAAVLAKSPRGVIVAPPEEAMSEAGAQEWVVKEGDKTASQMVRHVPSAGSSALAEEEARQAQPAQALNPMQQMIRNMCDMTVQAYRENMRSIVDEGWKAPKPPRKGVWIAKLKYDLMRDGQVSNIRVVQPSGFAPIDQSAIQRVQQMQGMFRPLPSCYDKSSMEIDHTFKVIYR